MTDQEVIEAAFKKMDDLSKERFMLRTTVYQQIGKKATPIADQMLQGVTQDEMHRRWPTLQDFVKEVEEEMNK